MEVIASIPENFPPQYSLDENGNPTGFAVESMEEIAKTANLKIRYKIGKTFAQAVEMLLAGESDLIPNSGISEHRLANSDFTPPIETFEIVIFVRKTTHDINGIEDLAGKKVGVVKVNEGIIMPRTDIKGKQYEHVSIALVDLLTGEIDALIYPKPVLVAIARKAGVDTFIKTVGPPLLEVKRGIRVQKNSQLLDRLTPAVEQFLHSESYRRIFLKWYGPPKSFWTTPRIITVNLIFFGIGVFVLLVWWFNTIRRLSAEQKKTIADRTAELSRANTLLTKKIKERIEVEAKLKFSENRLRTWLEASPVCTKIVDRNLKLQYMSSAGINALKVKDITGFYDKVYPFNIYPAPFNDNLKTCFDKAFNQKKTSRLETIALDLDGGKLWYDTTVIPLNDENQEVEYLLVVSIDITARKQTEIENTDLESRLSQAHKMEAVGNLAGGIAHDFNNMLGVILGNTEMVLEDLDTSHPSTSNLLDIQRAAQRSADLTRQLLTFARKQPIRPRVLDLNETVDGMLQMLKHLIGEHIILSMTPGQGLWPVEIDPSQLDQIVVNLAVNARDAITNIGDITIETSNATFSQDFCRSNIGFEAGEYVCISMADTGTGMDKATIEQLFEPFFTTKEVGEGTGLGLSTIYGIVKQNKGFIRVQSEPDKGTTFEIYLPRHTRKGESRPSGESGETPHKGGETILLVEDEPAILNMTKMLLERMGYTVLAAPTPGLAIKTARNKEKGEIQLLLTDVIMPEMNGRDLAERLTKLQPKMKCLFMSGYTADVIAGHGVLDKGVAFINKPFSSRELAAKLEKIIDQGSGSD